ncbi:oxygen-independent coproporphyrinogen III oxidase [Clostridium felsineum]|uniref:Coproporphyrinogen-III oxidase n=1 Tax=Clostridium felsineum TaxID=36839 RepID=A0A1S8M9I2_9CLOT|nr:oxygen-independent coproporphyrinogen III oxidase [Clostridium felsineum]MCR3757611.1 oxygen-independent coproporphyrinogen III oxidase [Clostridium felsineum]URZ03208.1 Oxygen-independent coproporphyrinogen III oxidase [Clostridium felsineum]URZ08452.1 Oxygen-independent coproporphyrinogen III oxidase [Clostridium felsineum]URZ13483.1 Oxygen-independent coproporphyrinogen III oxidase [Clostridium felsineum]
MKNENEEIHYLCQKYDAYNFPLYFSYPVDSYWKRDRLDNEKYFELSKIEDADLYVHFPYCKKICYYCCCDKLCTTNPEEIDSYLEYFDRELELKFDKTKKIKITSMHWGGGTPTYMSNDQIKHMMTSIKKYFEILPGSHINLEAYPDEELITDEKMQLLYDLGFRSISFGIQDFNERVQKAINRWCTQDVARRIIDKVKNFGFEVHVDLCYGLPYQGISEFEDTLKIIKSLSPDKVVIYAYAHYPYLYPLQKNIPLMSLPNSYMKIMMMNVAKEILEDEYIIYGLDTFVKKDGRMKHWEKENVVRNFMGASSNKDSHLIGIGMSAISMIDGVYFKNHTDMKKYKEDLDNKVIPTEKYHFMTEEDKLRHYIIQKQILSDFSINTKAVEQLFNVDFKEHFEKELEILKKLQDEGLVENYDGEEIKITKYGKYFVRLIAYVFDAYYANKEKMLKL